jgi:gluconolactonase
MNMRKIVAALAAVLALAVAVAPARAADGLDAILAPGAKAQVLGTGYGFSEGPAADAEGNVYFSDGKNNSIHLYRPGQPVAVFVNDSTDANGMMFNPAGELVVCEGAAYRVVAIDVKTRRKRVLVGEGQRQFNEPNDLAVDRTGGFYFTDPNYAHHGQKPLKKENAYYCAADGKVSVVSEVCKKPNGVLLSADDRILYLADCSAQIIYRYSVAAPGKLQDETKWLELDGHPDGMTLDGHGNLYIACGGKGVLVYSSDGRKIGAIGEAQGVPSASNCCFGGPDFRTLFITSRDKFLGIETQVRGVEPLPLRLRQK